MIQKLDLQNASAFRETSSQPQIDVTWGGISGWMVVNQDKGVSGMADDRFKDFARMSKAFV